jgi:hypothetical protein
VEYLSEEDFFDGKKWGKRIYQCRTLRELLENKEFLKDKSDIVLKTMYGGSTDTIRLIVGLEFVLDDDDTVREACEGITNNSLERRSLLHWYAFLVYAAAREFNLLLAGTKNGGES